MGAAGPARSIAVVDDPERASLLLDPGRRRLLEALLEHPDSAAGLARRLDEPRQRLNYHLRALEDGGLVELEEERRKGNCVERVLRVVARRFVVDPAALRGLAADPAELSDRFSAGYLVALASRGIRELAGLVEKAGEEKKRVATAGLDTRVRLATPADFEAFVEDLAGVVAKVVAEHHDEDARGRPFRVVAGTYPAPPGEAAGPSTGGSENE